ncbi:MAG: YciI family protein [Flavobacteriales bacterium]
MKRFFTLLVLFLIGSGLNAQRTFDVTIADSTYHMKQYWFVLYTTGDDTTRLDSATSAKLLQEHLAHQGAQAERGLIQVAGPFGDKSTWRGLLLYDCETKEEVEGYLRQDPFVKRGKLKYEIHPWYGAMGTMLR